MKEQVKAAKGLARIRDNAGRENSVRVMYDDGQTVILPESRYREQGYRPPLDELPWANGHEAKS